MYVFRTSLNGWVVRVPLYRVVLGRFLHNFWFGSWHNRTSRQFYKTPTHPKTGQINHQREDRVFFLNCNLVHLPIVNRHVHGSIILHYKKYKSTQRRHIRPNETLTQHILQLFRQLSRGHPIRRKENGPGAWFNIWKNKYLNPEACQENP